MHQALYTWKEGVNIILSMVVCGNYFAEPDTILVFKTFYEVFGGGTLLAMPKTICAPDSSSLKPGLGATEGVLDQGVSRCTDYDLWPDSRTMKIQD